MIFGKKNYMQWDNFSEKDKELEFWSFVNDNGEDKMASA